MVLLILNGSFPFNVFWKRYISAGVSSVQRILRHVCLRYREEREAWIRAKYEQRLFVAELPDSELGVGVRLLNTVLERDLASLLLLLAHSRKEEINAPPPPRDKDRRSALHLACETPDVVMTQLLVWVSHSSVPPLEGDCLHTESAALSTLHRLLGSQQLYNTITLPCKGNHTVRLCHVAIVESLGYN